MGVKISEWNNQRGQIQIHAPGCRDIKRSDRRNVDTYEVESVRDIVESVYPSGDFDYDADTEWESFAQDIVCMPCCPDLPWDHNAPVTAAAPATTSAPVKVTGHHAHTDCGHALTPAARATCRKTHTWDGARWV